MAAIAGVVAAPRHAPHAGSIPGAWRPLPWAPGAARDLAVIPAEELLRRQADGDAQARRELVRRYLPFARELALRYRSTGEPMDDLVQVASIGLLQAIDRYDGTRGTQFTTFAAPTASASSNGTSAITAGPFACREGSRSGAQRWHRRSRHFTQASDAGMPCRRLNGMPFQLRFFYGLTQQVIGQRIGYSQMHVSRLLRRALERLRAAAAPSREAA